MNENTIVKLRQIYKDFYFGSSNAVGIPTRISEREFGYIPFGGSMIRHRSFKLDGDLKAFLVREAPHSVYYSISFYLEPTRPMSEKGWKGADVVFDIDCDDLNTPCKRIHDRWLCKTCGFVGVGVRPAKCMKCGSERISELNWVCDDCLDAAKTEALKLLDILMKDLGVQKHETKTYFSGSMGYHISVEGSAFEELEQTARNEVADYVTGTSLLPRVLGISEHRSFEEMVEHLPSIAEQGWRGRIARYFADYQLNGYHENNGDVRRKMACIYRELGYSRLKRAVEEAVKKVGSAIDTTVTTDIHRIFRLPGTLHGETGLMKTQCKNLITFDPLTDAVVLDGDPIEVSIEHSPRFRLREQRYGPFETDRVKLPLIAATYLMARGLAEVV